MSPSVESATPLCASTPRPLPLTNGHDAVDNKRNNNNCDSLNGNVNVNIVTESTSMDVLSGGESDAGDTLSRRNNNSISSVLTGTLRDVTDTSKRRGADVTYFIAKEMLMTERTYKRDLELVTVTWSSRVSELSSTADSEAVVAMARVCLALEPLALPQGALLARLERTLAPNSSHKDVRDNEEPEYKKIAELLHDYLSSTYEAYERYTESAGPLVGVVESVRRLHADVERACLAFDSTAPLPLAALLLRPLHRAEHYRRLATELALTSDGSSSQAALEFATRLAENAEEQLRHAENHATLCQLQRDILGFDKLLVAEREFIKLGCVYKHSGRGLQQRILFLLSDVLVVCSKCGSQFRAHAALPLHALRLELSTLPHSFTLTGDDVNMMLSASNEQEFAGWMLALETAIENARESPTVVDTELTPYEQDTGMSCGGSGSGSGGGGLAHVCWHRVTSLDRHHLHLAMTTQLSGYLLRKFKNSHGWQKLWVVFAAFTLFFYKSWQDAGPLASLPLLGYSVGAPSPGDGIHKDFVFKLQFKNHVYFFRADSQYTYNRWTEVLQTAMVNNHHN